LTAVAKPKKNDDRRARLEQMRREAQRAERRRTMAVVVVCAVVALGIVAATAWYLLTQEAEGSLAESAAAAGCGDVVLRGAEGSAAHQRDGTPIDYEDAPPAFGEHWDTPAGSEPKFYPAEERPPVEQLVHNLEHGYTILWYDETVADDAEALEQVEAIAQEFEGDPDPAAKFIAAPWTSEDGGSFPSGKHLALTHWSATGEEAVPGQGVGVWLYCAEPSEEVVSDFMAEYPSSNSLEPTAP